VKWVHQDKIGYIFPEPTTIHLSNQLEQGRWSDITDQKNISEEIVNEKVFMLWFDHGKRPDAGSYEYIVVPDVTERELRETSANNRHLEILSNTPEIQAVLHNKLGIIQVAFYRSGEVEIPGGFKIRMDSQGMAMLKMKGDRIGELTVSDPSRKLNRLCITVPGIYTDKGEHFVAYPESSGNATLILVDLPQDVFAGKSVTIKLE
jgi:chondroitin AC lyase